jgi:hypothetical protein
VKEQLKSPELDVNLHDLNPPELKARLYYLKAPENQGQGFQPIDWIWLLLLGVIAPIVLIIWGWLS